MALCSTPVVPSADAVVAWLKDKPAELLLAVARSPNAQQPLTAALPDILLWSTRTREEWCVPLCCLRAR